MLDTEQKIVGKADNAGNQHFLLFQQSFLAYLKDRHHHLRSILFVITANTVVMLPPKNLLCGQHLTDKKISEFKIVSILETEK